jgi:hypothetical protein
MKKVLLFLLCLLFASFAKAGLPQVAYIYASASASDSASALAFQNLLDSTGYGTQLFDTSQVTAANFSVFRIIVIGPGTGDFGTWGDSAAVAAIRNSGKPVIGVGEGGYAFFGKLKLNIGYANGAHGADSVMEAILLPHAIYVTPQPIAFGFDSNLTLYAKAVDVVSISFNSIPANVNVFGADHADTSLGYLIQEDSRYLLWGFSASAALLTQDGQQLFVNVVDFMSKSYSNARVAYIYKDSTSAGLDVAAFLQQFGVSTQLISISNVDSVSFAPYGLIIVDGYSGNFGLWGDPTAVQNIAKSGKSVLGMGFGGASLFQQMGISMNWGNSSEYPDTTVTVLDSVEFLGDGFSYTETPNDIRVGSGLLYTHTGGVEEYIPSLGEDVVGVAAYANENTYYAVMNEGIHALWGPSNSPSDMTQLGKNLFYNMVAGHFTQVVTGVKTHAGGNLPKQFSLSQNYPNPFNPATRIQYSLPSAANVTLAVYNILGQRVATLFDGMQSAGVKSAVWNANAFSSGVYFYKFEAVSAGSPSKTFTDVKKLVLLK